MTTRSGNELPPLRGPSVSLLDGCRRCCCTSTVTVRSADGSNVGEALRAAIADSAAKESGEAEGDSSSYDRRAHSSLPGLRTSSVSLMLSQAQGREWRSGVCLPCRALTVGSGDRARRHRREAEGATDDAERDGKGAICVPCVYARCCMRPFSARGVCSSLPTVGGGQTRLDSTAAAEGRRSCFRLASSPRPTVVHADDGTRTYRPTMEEARRKRKQEVK